MASIKKRERRRIEKTAAYKSRRILGFGFQKSNKELFIALGEHFGTAWNGTTPHGYEMAIKLAGVALLPPKGTKHREAKARLAKAVSDAFLSSYEWRSLRMRVLIRCGARCQCCGQSAKDGVVIHVDHIKPRRKYPELALEESNLQVLCEICNHGKGNWDETNWSEPQTVELPDERFAPMWSKRPN